MKEYFTQSTDDFVVMVKPAHYPSIKGMFKDDKRILKVILFGSGKIPIQQQNKIAVSADCIKEALDIFILIKEKI